MLPALVLLPCTIMAMKKLKKFDMESYKISKVKIYFGASLFVIFVVVHLFLQVVNKLYWNYNG